MVTPFVLGVFNACRFYCNFCITLFHRKSELVLAWKCHSGNRMFVYLVDVPERWEKNYELC